MTARTNALAQELRRRHALADPPVPDGLVYLDDVKVLVRLTTLPSQISGALVRLPETAVIWLERTDSPERRRFTLMHELAHLHLHQAVFFCHAESRRENALEQEANDFATEMLMPRSWLLRDLAQRGPHVVRLAQRYRVSPVAMRRRLQELGLN